LFLPLNPGDVTMEFVDKKELTKDKFAYLLNISGRNFAITYLRDDIETPTKDIYTRLHDNTYISVRYGTLRMEPDLINLSESEARAKFSCI
jgi:hypothetical protein